MGVELRNGCNHYSGRHRRPAARQAIKRRRRLRVAEPRRHQRDRRHDCRKAAAGGRTNRRRPVRYDHLRPGCIYQRPAHRHGHGRGRMAARRRHPDQAASRAELRRRHPHHARQQRARRQRAGTPRAREEPVGRDQPRRSADEHRRLQSRRDAANGPAGPCGALRARVRAHRMAQGQRRRGVARRLRRALRGDRHALRRRRRLQHFQPAGPARRVRARMG